MSFSFLFFCSFWGDILGGELDGAIGLDERVGK